MILIRRSWWRTLTTGSTHAFPQYGPNPWHADELAFTNFRRISTMNCCSHLFEIGNVTPETPNGCEECLKMGDRWLHLRLCVTCGHVGCCDDSKNKHAAKHFHSTNHPLIKSFEPDEEWGWCYVDELLLESVPGSLTTEWCGVLGATP